MKFKPWLVMSAFVGLVACEIDPDWEQYISIIEPNVDRMEWLQDLEFGPNNQLLSVSLSNKVSVLDRNETLSLTSFNANGNRLWQKQYEVGINKDIPDVEPTASGWLLAMNNSVDIEEESQLISIDASGNQNWSVFLADGKLRDITIGNGQIYVTGLNTYIFDFEGNLKTQVEHNGNTTWTVEPVNNGFVVAGHAFTARFDNFGNELWKTSHAPDLVHQVDVVIKSNKVTVAQEWLNEDKASVQQFDLQTGQRIWNRTLRLPSGGEYSIHGYALLKALENDYLLVLSNPRKRQMIRLSDSGRTKWSKTTDAGLVFDMELMSSGKFVVSGDGVTQQFESNGDLVATAKMPSGSMDTTGAVEVLGNNVFAASSITDRERVLAVYLARYSEN